MSTKNAKRRLPTKIAQPIIKQSAKVVGNGALDESRAVVSGGGKASGKSTEIISISSNSSSSDGEDISEAEEGQEEETGADVSMADGDVAVEEGEDTAEPSFGDLVRANTSEVIDVAGAFDDLDNKALAFPTKVQPPSGASLGTVLTQALKTNDVALLESCLHTADVNTIRATIQRLDSTLAGSLLQKLAERLHKRPGRAGSLMVWVQWTLVTHGGFLATQPDLIKKLAGLNRVIEERAKGLTSLLSLKGKLDMLEAQTELRRSMQNQRRRAEEDDNEDDVIYVEGEESDDETSIAKPKRLSRNGDLVDISDEESDGSEDMPNTNGVIADSEDEEESSDEGFLDDEAEETDADSGDEDEVDHDDQDSQEEESEDNEAPPSKLQRVGGAFAKKR